MNNYYQAMDMLTKQWFTQNEVIKMTIVIYEQLDKYESDKPDL